MHLLRDAIPSDEPFLLRLTSRLAAFPVPPWRTPEEIERADHPILLEALHQPTKHTLILVAVHPAGAPAGFVFVSTKTDYFTGASHAHVEVLAVTPEAEGQGLGRALLEGAEGWARERGHNQITLNVFERNERARGVYERLAYEPETIHYRKELG